VRASSKIVGIDVRDEASRIHFVRLRRKVGLSSPDPLHRSLAGTPPIPAPFPWLPRFRRGCVTRCADCAGGAERDQTRRRELVGHADCVTEELGDDRPCGWPSGMYTVRPNGLTFARPGRAPELMIVQEPR
jgi:hypothetical protein